MKPCPKCNTLLNDNVMFCSNCGTNVSQQPVINRVTGTSGRLHCPRCKSAEITPVVETTSSGAVGSRVTKNISVASTYHSTKSFWMCNHCGHKFRNIEDWEEEIATLRRTGNFVILLFCGLEGIVVALFLLVTLLSGNFIFFPCVVMCAAMFVFSFRYQKKSLQKRLAKLGEECNQLKHDCFD